MTGRLGAAIAVVALAGAACQPAWAHHEGWLASNDRPPATSHTYLLKVEGMMCPTSCAPKVKEALLSVDGVESVEIDFDTKQATVRVQAGHTLSVEACDKAFGNAGYFVDSIEELPAEPVS
jgi:copper chaperone CopZ